MTTRFAQWGFTSLKDWLDVLLVPLVIALIGTVLAIAQSCSQQAAENQRAQDSAVQSYLDQMSTLLVPKGGSSKDEESESTSNARAEVGKNTSLKDTTEDDEKRMLARSRTLTVLDRLGRKRSSDRDLRVDVVQFLSESYLITGLQNQKLDTEGKPTTVGLPIVSLKRANLEGIDLSWRNLNEVNLDDSDLRGANFSHSLLIGSYLGGANLTKANFSNADLRGAYLAKAKLNRADLINADLGGADLTEAKGINTDNLEKNSYSLKGATMPDGSKHD
jgi:hypothetical protein